VYQGDIPRTQAVQNYHINVANKRYQNTVLHLSVSGLPAGSFSLSRDTVHFDTADRSNVMLNVDNRLIGSRGLHQFVVTAKSDDGWTKSFRLMHLSE